MCSERCHECIKMAKIGLDVGLQHLWRDESLTDFTIRVEGRALRVHKVLFAAVSDYFRTMLTGPMVESSANYVELKEQRFETVSKLVELVYIRDQQILENNASELLNVAVKVSTKNSGQKQTNMRNDITMRLITHVYISILNPCIQQDMQ